MDLPPTSHATGRYDVSPRERATSFGMALAVTVGLFALLVTMGDFEAPPPKGGARLVAVTLHGEEAEKKQSAAKAHKTQETTAPQQAAAPRQMVPLVTLPSQNKLQLPDGFIQMSHADLASADIGKMHSAPAAGAGSGAGESGGGGAGEGPGGERLYNAEWYREPTHAELAGYMPAGGTPGEWGMIACRTIDHFHVEDCQEMDESPRGSGLARALRQAAWQFLVRPPRLNGKPLIGAWVRIRFNFTERKRDEDGAG